MATPTPAPDPVTEAKQNAANKLAKRKANLLANITQEQAEIDTIDAQLAGLAPITPKL